MTDLENKYYPSLNSLISIDNLPDFIGDTIKTWIAERLEEIYAKDFYKSRSIDNISSFYSMELVLGEKASFEFPGTGISIVLNPSWRKSVTCAEYMASFQLAF